MNAKVKMLSFAVLYVFSFGAMAHDERPELRVLGMEVGTWDAKIEFPSDKEGAPSTLAPACRSTVS